MKKTWVLLCAAVCAMGATGCGADDGVPCHGRVSIRTRADVEAASQCSSLDGDLWVTASDVSSLDGLGKLRSVRYLVVAGNPALTSLQGLQGLEHADGITLYGNPRLADLSALERLEGVGAVVAIGARGTALGSIARVASGDVTLASDADWREFSFDFD